MKKTVAEVTQIGYDLVKGSPLEGAISGTLRKGDRPANSDKEDVTVNVLPIDNEQLQQCVVNVNVFVPNFKVEENEVQTDQPDYARLQTLSRIAADLFSHVRKVQEWQIELELQSIVKDQDSHSHFINNRLRFQAYNIEQ